ncbi:putative sodium-dependent multivitamin transporter isoform X2 [Rhipicephalus microplus]|uniref:putative sodium-dependent multivitamin transporter isoform X2 n=1 Tax=Rhipicephalus microplus TaxID=6941 RepID=UPI003F6B32C2
MAATPLIIIGKVIYDSPNASPPLRPLSDFNVTHYIFRTNLDLTSEENFWSCLAGTLPYSFVRTGFDQMAVQRFIAARTLQQAKRMAITGAVFVVIFLVMAAVGALTIIYWYRDCDLALSGAISSYDQVVPYFVKERLSDVTMLRGVFLAGLVGASTSTVSSIVNSHAATFYIDIVSPYIDMSEKTAVRVMRLLALASGTIMTLFAIAVPYLGTATRGAAWACLFVCALQLWHAVGRGLSAIPRPPVIQGTMDRCPILTNTTDSPDSVEATIAENLPYVFPLYRVSFYWIALSGEILTMLLGTIFSLATGGGRNIKSNLHLTSTAFLSLWRRSKFFQRILQNQEAKSEEGEKDSAGNRYGYKCMPLTDFFSKDQSKKEATTKDVADHEWSTLVLSEEHSFNVTT